MFKLNEQQNLVLDILSDKSRNIALLGSAGVGKSTIIRAYLAKNPNTKVLTSTGVAAVMLGTEVKATTFHSFFGLGTMSESLDFIINNAFQNEAVKWRIRKTEEIIIDEVSMLPGKALDMANYISKLVRNSDADAPFGNIRIIVVGDFYQLGPVSEKGKPTDWAFDSYSWDEANFLNAELSEIMRTSDSNFIQILHKVRSSLIDSDVSKFLNSRIIKKDEEFEGTRIYSRKKQVQDYNQSQLAKLTTPLKIFPIEFTGEDNAIERLKRSLPIDNPVIIKEGALVMTRVNYKDKKSGAEYVNGTTGHVTSISNEHVIIRTLEGKLIPIFKTHFSLTDFEGDVLASAYCLPITLSWAITVHKSQGSNLSRALVDLTNGGTWASGLGYTALSRLTNSQGLRIVGWNRYSFHVDPRVLNFYKKFREKK